MYNLSPYVGFFLIEYKRILVYLPDQFYKALLLILRIALPYTIFSGLVVSGKITQEMANTLVWSVLGGQILNLASMRLFDNIRDDIRSGDIVLRLQEPINYAGAMFSRAFGYFIPTFFLLMILFFIPCYILFPIKIQFFTLIIFTILSFILRTVINILLGLSNFFIEQNEGIFWIINKMFFVFGNQVVPVSLMPVYVIGIAQKTPFYLSLAGPIEASTGNLDVITGFTWTIGYIILLGGMMFYLLDILRKKVILNG
ncbi:MAG: hypothetical protein WCO06_04290 [Candidatus Roizmanbacteria bacterium]